MRAVIQRVVEARVAVAGRTVGEIGQGILVLLGVEKQDQIDDADYLAAKTSGLRIFPDDDGKMNLSVADIQGHLLVVSQFTLCGDTRKGRRPSFINAADPEEGNRLYEAFVERLKQKQLHVETGQFQADMQVYLINDGPVTILLDSRKLF